MREFIIREDDAGQRLDKFIAKAVPLLPKSLLYKSVRNKKIKVNRKRCEISTRLQCGDTIQCFLAEEFFETSQEHEFLKVPAKLKVVYEDEDVIIVDKPHGLLSHKDSKGVQDNLQDRLLHYLYERNSYQPETALSFTPAFVHRLDRNTEGLMIAGKHAASLRTLNEAMRQHAIHKYYLCVVEGRMERTSGHIVLYHEKLEGNQARLHAQPKEGCVRIDTWFKTLKRGRNHSLVEVELQGGKSHQVRAVMAYLKHPLVGDVKYGAKRDGSSHYHHLYAYRLWFDCELEGLMELSHQSIETKAESIYQLWNQTER